MTNDILYSFRRCPYAIRARWAMLICEIKVEIREIDLKNKPLDFLNKSKTKTVPILIKKDREVIEVGNVTLSNKKIKQVLGWKPEYDLKNGLIETKEYFLPRLDRYLK